MVKKRRLPKSIVGLSASFLLALMAEGIITPVQANDEQPSVATTTQIEKPSEPTDNHINVEQAAEFTPNAESTEQEAPLKTAVDTSAPQIETALQNEPVSEVAIVEEAPIAEQEAVAPITLEEQTVYLSEANDVTITLKTPETEINWQINGLPDKTYVIEDGTFTGEQLLNVSDVQTANDQYQANLTIKPLLGEDLGLRWPNNIRRSFRDYMGTYVLEGRNAAGELIAQKPLVFRPYQSYQTYEEMVAFVDNTMADHANDRYVGLEIIGKSAQGRDLRMGIVADKETDISDYLDHFTPQMLQDPASLIKQIADGKLDYKVPIIINNTHADEQPGIDIIAFLFNDFATKDTVSYQTLDANQNKVSVLLNVKDLLKHAILIFNFTENPDGDLLNTRSLANGIDPNRDAGYQANPETRAIAAQISKWNPASLYDIHGFVKEFLIEPATPPHDLNFEYDLLEKTMLEQAKTMGTAGISSSKYTSFIIPRLDYGAGWDDAFSGYTAVYSMHHGVLGHTVEIPEMNQESFYAGYAAVLAGINYNIQNKDEITTNRLNYYLRGINKIEDKKAENQFIDPNGNVVGRPKGDNPKFFPDYYVIPMGLSKESDSQQAFEMIAYLKRNGVIVNELTKDVGNYQKGDLVIDMAQAKRGYANHVLYKGNDESAWPEMYAEVVMNFPAMRGFKAEAVFSENLFKDVLGQPTHQMAPRSVVDPKASYYMIHNNSLSSIQAVNTLLKQGGKVFLTTDGYVVKTPDFSRLLTDFALLGTPLYNKEPMGIPLKPMKIYAPGNPNRSLGYPSVSEATLSLTQMGFEIVDSLDEADVLVLDSNQFDKDLLGKKPTLIIGGSAMRKLERLGVLDGFDAETLDNGNSYEGLLRALVDKTNPLSSGYRANDLVYSNSGSWIKSLPPTFKQLLSVSPDNDFYISGWWPGHDAVKGQIMAIDGTYMDQPLFVYAGNPMNKLHTLYFYRWVSNAILRGELTDFKVLAETPDNDVTVIEHHHTQMAISNQPMASQPTAATLPNTGDETTVVWGLIGLAATASSGLLAFKWKKEYE
ncbi:LPXTG cell wall anchor domain-containing protein [Streptococcus pacificus]|uniref:LPXTG cell wall anchor domain-containing protein n=1 Tax=Streptococcus pacificus TaxID=2740577 RepID=A0ABS0ZKH4_9STRE|nr:LPXTG cell wall anchor domain-containing protein [Streptococcus pacificus]MBJ8326457.1 LPXTG cell wall anchor domain-containing protein [Streptococcus pacificus]